MEDTLLVHPTAQGLYEVFEKMPFEEQEKFIKLIEIDSEESKR